MGSLIWRGDAKPVAQVVKITPSNPEPGDTFTIKINGKVVEFVATDSSVATVVDGLAEAWNAATFPEATLITAAAVDSDEDGESDYLELTADEAGVPFRVETETTDAGGFDVVVSTVQAGTEDTNEKQRITLPATAAGGTFTLTFSGQTTGAIAYDASAATVQTALEALSNIAAGDVIVTGDAGGPWTVEFAQAYAGVNVPLMTGDGSSLTGSADVSIQTTTEGSGGVNEVQQIRTATTNSSTSANITITDPISGATATISILGSMSASGIQSAFDNALATLGTGGAATVTKTSGPVGTGTSPSTYSVEFSGTWAFTNVTAMTSNNAAVTISTLTEGTATGVDEVQRVALLYGPTGGTFTLTFNAQTTAGIAYNAAAAAVQSALEALSSIGAGNVTVAGSAGGPWDVTFASALGGQDVAEMTGDGSSLTGGSVTIATTQNAASGANEIQLVEISPDPSGGTFTLTVDPGGGGETTGALDFDATAAEVQTAIEGLASFAPGDVSVSGDAGGPWTVEFTGNFAETDLALITGDGANLTGGGDQGLAKITTTRSQGPNHFDDPDNWTGEAVPGAADSIYFSGGAVDCLWGLRQMADFTADAAEDLLTFAEAADFVEGQKIRLFTTDTLPAGLSAATDYFILNLDYDAGTCQLSATLGGAAVDITSAGTGTHTIALHLTAARFHSRWTGALGLTERNELEFYEYRPRSLAVVVDDIIVGEGEGDGQNRLDLNTGTQPTTIIIHQTGGSNEPGLPAIRWKGDHADNAIAVHDGEFGVAVYATETATIDTLVQYSGLVQMGTATIGSITKHGGELTAENATLSGALQLHG